MGIYIVKAAVATSMHDTQTKFEHTFKPMARGVYYFSDAYAPPNEGKIKSYEQSILQMESGHLDVDCVNREGYTLLFVLLDYCDPTQAKTRKWIARVCALRPSIVTFWKSYSNWKCKQDHCLECIPDYLWSNLDVVQEEARRAQFMNSTFSALAAAEVSARRRFRLPRRIWLAVC